MEYQIQVSKEAEKDLAIAKHHYTDFGLEYEFTEDYLTQIKYLKANPYLFQIRYKIVRKVHFKIYKYSMHYVIKNDIVYILRILNHSQEYDNS